MSQSATFDARLDRLAQKHERIRAFGYAGRLTEDGLVVMVPRRGKAPSFPLRGLLGVTLVALAFKTYLLASLGAADYGVRLEALQGGTPIERAGAWVMSVDPVTQFAADMVARAF